MPEILAWITKKKTVRYMPDEKNKPNEIKTQDLAGFLIRTRTCIKFSFMPILEERILLIT